MRKLLYLLLILNIFPILLRAQSGGPPMITDDPGTPDKGAWELNFSFNTDMKEFEKEFEAPLLDINFGFNERTQLKLEFPWLFSKSVPYEYQNRFGDITLGIKYRFFDEDKSGFSFSIYPQIGIATQNDAKNEYLFPVQLEKHFGKIVLGMDLRYGYLMDETDYFQNGILLGIDVSEKLNLMSEFVYWANAKSFTNAEGVMNFGLKYQLNSIFTFMTSMGTGVFSPGKDSRISFISFVGFQINI
jgi:hypothetical protein